MILITLLPRTGRHRKYKRIRGILKEPPPFCTDFFRGIEPRTSARTRLAYAYDLKTFFDFLNKQIQSLIKEAARICRSLLDEIKLMVWKNIWSI
ncbi:MAG: hypothetical protein ACLVB2_06025 [Clostridium fessum]